MQSCMGVRGNSVFLGGTKLLVFKEKNFVFVGVKSTEQHQGNAFKESFDNFFMGMYSDIISRYN